MYKEHKVVLFFISFCCGILSYIFKVDYSIIASEGITVVSIVLVIYMTSFSGLVSSKLANKMYRKEDKRIIGKSQLGVLKNYLNAAVGICIVNITVGCITLILDSLIGEMQKNNIYYMISAFGTCTLAVNLLFMFLLFRFMVNRQLWDD